MTSLEQALLLSQENVIRPVSPTTARQMASELYAQTQTIKIRTILEYWLSIGAADRLPSRRDLDVTTLGGAMMPNIWLIDVVQTCEKALPVRFRYRLTGSKIVAAYGGRNPTGQFLDEFHANYNTLPIDGYLRATALGRYPAWRRGPRNMAAIMDILSVERIYLPLANDGETVDMILALTVFFRHLGKEW